MYEWLLVLEVEEGVVVSSIEKRNAGRKSPSEQALRASDPFPPGKTVQPLRTSRPFNPGKTVEAALFPAVARLVRFATMLGRYVDRYNPGSQRDQHVENEFFEVSNKARDIERHLAR